MKEKIHTDNAPKAVGPYSQAIKHGNYVFCSGQIPLDPTTQKLVEGDVSVQCLQVLKNLHEVLKVSGSEWKNIIKTTIFLSDMSLFKEVNTVYEGFFNEFAPGEPAPARATVAVKTLPLNVDVEIDCIAFC